MEKRIIIHRFEAYVLLFVVLVLFNLLPLSPTGFVAANVSIIEESKGLLYEERDNDTTFHINLDTSGNWFLYNGTSGGFHGGFDTGNFSDGTAQLFFLDNRGSTFVDITISASDPDNGTGSFFQVSRTSGEMQIFIPTVGWKYVPDGDTNDADSTKDSVELCIANDFTPVSNFTTIDFRVRDLSESKTNGSYIGLVRVTVYNNATINPCSTLGSYVTP